MAFRLIRYAVAAMQRHLEAGHKKLPLVIPVLFYVVKRSPYPYSTRWLDEFDNPELAAKLYSTAFPLVDVTVIPDDEIIDHRRMAALTLQQKRYPSTGSCGINRQTGHNPVSRISLFNIGGIAGTLYLTGRQYFRCRSLCSRTCTACALTRRRTHDHRTTT